MTSLQTLQITRVLTDLEINVTCSRKSNILIKKTKTLRAVLELGQGPNPQNPVSFKKNQDFKLRK